MKSVLSLDETPPLLERSLSAASKRSRELPTDIEMESVPLMRLSPGRSYSCKKPLGHHKILTFICKNF